MAQIVLNDTAPAEAIHFSLAQAEFDLGGKSDAQSYDTTDPIVLANAQAHPWLTVEADEGVEYVSDDTSRQVAPEDDPMSAVNSVAFDLDEIRKVEDAKRAAYDQPLAVDAGLDQGEVVMTGPVAETLAADEDHESAKSARNFAADTSTEGDE
jgi:hypothetical protein